MRLSHISGLGMSFLVLALGTNIALGQSNANRISLESGTVFEIGVDTQIERPQFSWVLTRDREFVSAQQTTFFQTRQTTPGTYTLDVNVSSEDRNRNEFHTFVIDIADVQTLPPSFGSGVSVAPVVTFDPPANASKTISVEAQGGLVKIDASNVVGVTTFSFDLDGTKDENGDGNPFNDQDNAGTASEVIGGPLYYYFLPSDGPRLLGLNFEGQSPVTDQYSIVFSGRTSSTPNVPQGGTVPILADQNGLSVRFRADIDPSLFGGAPVVYEWEFGDHRRSLLDRPTHRYAEEGTYVVSVNIRDIRTGNVLFGGTTQTTVSVSQGTSSSSSSSSEGPNESGTGFGTILKIVLALGVLLGLALFVYFIIKKLKDLTAGRLQKKLEEVEGKLFESEKKPQNTSDEPAPLQLKKPQQEDIPSKQEVVDREKRQTELDRSPEQPLAQSTGPMPAWLQSQPTPKQTPIESKPTPPAPPAPAPKAPPDPSAPPPPPETKTIASPPEPKPQPPAQSKATPAPMPAPAPESKPVLEPAKPITPPPVPSKPQPAATPAPTPTPTPTSAESPAPKASDASRMTPEEREAERKRKKRQRYRKNKRLREQQQAVEATDQPKPTPNEPVAQKEVPKEEAKSAPAEPEKSPDEPIAIIRADSLEDNQKKDEGA